MAAKLSKKELARTQTDFDAPEVKHLIIPQSKAARESMKILKGKGNPNGRPPSLDPRKNHIGINLTDGEKARLEETAHLMNTTKTNVIVKGIDALYLQAKTEERRARKEVE